MAAKKLEIEALTSDGIRHGFFTRLGGVSGGLYDSLNCGYGSDDAPDHVTQNRALVCAELGVAGAALVTPYQHHSSDVVVATKAWAPSEAPRADAVVTQLDQLAIGVLTADCAPVLFAAPNAGIIGAAHAGWRGAFGGVLQATVETMVQLGAKREAIVAGVGPALSLAHFEVGDEFFDRFVERDPDFARFFHRPAADKKHHFDLATFALFQLRSAGIERAFACQVCTYQEEARFFSYRRNTHRGLTDYGRQISAIVKGL